MPTCVYVSMFVREVSCSGRGPTSIYRSLLGASFEADEPTGGVPPVSLFSGTASPVIAVEVEAIFILGRIILFRGERLLVQMECTVVQCLAREGRQVKCDFGRLRRGRINCEGRRRHDVVTSIRNVKVNKTR